MKVKNIKTGVIKDLKSQIEASMYLATKEWIIFEEKKINNNNNNSFKKHNEG